ncbi:uncharacterized protein LOC135694502 [Rhopilema esculentum]|uniref:uncharacterized protein LOC135694502 n=1 Tax=Rhopilema esculentum TaxID=499914 RepID=UPI0031E37F01
MASSEGEIKVNSSKSSDVVNGNSTDVVCYNFTNRIFILLTQFQRPGTMIHIEKQDSCQDVYSNQDIIDISTDVLLGVDDPIYQVYAKKIASVVFKETKKPILLAIALKDKSPPSIPLLSGLVLKNNVWSY